MARISVRKLMRNDDPSGFTRVKVESGEEYTEEEKRESWWRRIIPIRPGSLGPTRARMKLYMGDRVLEDEAITLPRSEEQITFGRSTKAMIAAPSAAQVVSTNQGVFVRKDGGKLFYKENPRVKFGSKIKRKGSLTPLVPNVEHRIFHKDVLVIESGTKGAGKLARFEIEFR